MIADTKNMTVGKPWKLILEFALPVFLSQVFQQLYNTIDSIIVGNFLGTEALAAVSSSGNLIFLFISFFTGTSMGVGVVISRYFGARDSDSVSSVIHTNLAFGFVSGILLTAAGILLSPTLLRWMNTDPEVLPQAVTYFRFYFVGVSAVILYNFCTGIMNALGDSRRPLCYLIFSSALNIGLDLLLIGGLGFGVGAAAVATTISQAVSVLLCLRHLCRKGMVYQVQLRKIRFHRGMLFQILKYGLPSGIQSSVISLANVIVQTYINSFGKSATAAYGAYSKIEGFGLLPVISFTLAISTFIGQNLGARQYDRARRGTRFGIFTAMVIAECIGGAVYLAAPELFRLFSKDTAVIAIGTQEARIIALFYFLPALSHATAAIFRGSGKPLVPMLILLTC